jgi:integrase
MTVISEPRTVLIEPTKDFGSFSCVCRTALGDDGLDLTPRYFDAPLLAIVVDRDGQPVWAPTLFLAECALRGRSVTGDTVRSYAEALQTWFAFLEDMRVGLDDVTEDDFAVFRSHIVHRSSSVTGRPRASSTANHRISVVSRFHLWGEKCGAVSTRLGAFLKAREDERRGYSRLHTPHFRQQGSPLAPAIMQRLPRLLSHEEIKAIFQVARPTYRLVFKWALVTGLRRFEICALTIPHLPSSEKLALSRDGLAQIDILRKGSRNVTVQVPVRLIEETHWYVLTERTAPLQESEQKIFIGKRGNPIDRQAVTREFRRCANDIGTDATLHHLRHTFAVNVLAVLDSRASDDDPLNSIKTLQVLMGHSSLESTELYLRAMAVSSESVMQALDYLYGATL